MHSSGSIYRTLSRIEAFPKADVALCSSHQQCSSHISSPPRHCATMPVTTKQLLRLRPLLTWPILTAAVASLVNDHLFEVLSVAGSSMTPTLSPTYHATGVRDYMLLLKYQPTLGLARGDVVAFYAPHRPERLVVKRVIGLAGDEVVPDTRRTETGMGLVRVPEGHVWVEGDNWRASGDSNLYGPVSRSLITGRALCIVWPWARCGAKPWQAWKGDDRVRTRSAEVGLDGLAT